MGAGVMKKGGGGNRRRRGSRGKAGVMAEINVTPFVDVMLVLLIIFMVAAPLMTVGVPLELPKTAAQAVPTEQEEPLTISLQADGKISIQNTETPEGELIAKLSAIASERQDKKLFLRAEGALNSGGFNNIVLVTDTGGPTFKGGAASGQAATGN